MLRRNPAELPTNLKEALGGVSDVNLFTAPLEQLEGLNAQVSAALDTTERVNRWVDAVTQAGEKGIDLTYIPYSKDLLKTGEPIAEADLIVVVSVGGFEWLARKVANHTPGPNAFYHPSPPPGVTQGSLSGVRSILLITPVMETMTKALSADKGESPAAKGPEQLFWASANQLLPLIIAQVDMSAERQLAGFRRSGSGAQQSPLVTVPFKGTVDRVETFGGKQYAVVSGEATPAPIEFYSAHIPALRSWVETLAKKAAGSRTPYAGQQIEELEKIISTQTALADRLSRTPDSAKRTLDIYGYNFLAAEHHGNVLMAERDVLLTLRQSLPPGPNKLQVSQALTAVVDSLARVKEYISTIPMKLRSASLQERARGYGEIRTPLTQYGSYEYRPARQEVVRIEKFEIPAGQSLSFAVGDGVDSSVPLTAYEDTGPKEEVFGQQIVDGDSALQPQFLGKKRMVPSHARVTLFFQPRPVTNEKIHRVISPMIPVPVRQEFALAFNEVMAEVEAGYPEWFSEEESRLGRDLTSEEGIAVAKREAQLRVSMTQKIQFTDALNGWLKTYGDPWLDAMSDALRTETEDAEARMTPEEFGKIYYPSQPGTFPSAGRFEDLTAKGLRAAQDPKLKERARFALLKPTKRTPEPKEPTEEQIAQRAAKLSAPQPTSDAIFLYIVDFFDAAGTLLWEGTIPSNHFVKELGVRSGPFSVYPVPPNISNILRAAKPGMSFNPSERSAVAYYADLASWAPVRKPGEDIKRGEAIGAIESALAAGRQYETGQEPAQTGTIRLRHARAAPKSDVKRTLEGESVRGQQNVGTYSFYDVNIAAGAVGVFQGIQESRLDQYLNYEIPKAIAAANNFGANRARAIEWAVAQQAQRAAGARPVNDAFAMKSPRALASDMEDILGEYSLTSKAKSNPMYNRLLNNPRYRQLVQRTGRMFGQPLRNPDDSGDKTEDEYFEEFVARPFDALDYEEELNTPDHVVDPVKLAAFRRWQSASPSGPASQPRQAEPPPAPNRPAPPPAASEATSSEKPRRRRSTRTTAATEPDVDAPASGRPPRRRRVPTTPASTPDPASYVTPDMEAAPRARAPAPSRDPLTDAEADVAAAYQKAAGRFRELAEGLRSERTSTDRIEAIKGQFEIDHRELAKAIGVRNDAYRNVNGDDALIRDLSLKQRKAAERASTPFARGPDGINEKLGRGSREDLLNRLAGEIAWDGTPLFSPDRQLLKRGLSRLKLTSPEEATELNAMSARSAPTGLDVSRFSTMSPAPFDAALTAARSQGQLKRIRPKATSTALLQATGAQGSHNIQPATYTAPMGVLDRGYDRRARQEKRAVVLWMSPSSDHIIRYTTGPTPEDEFGRLDVAMVGQFEVAPGENWREMLNAAFRHTVEWYSDIRKGSSRQEGYDLWFGKSGWPYLYRLYSGGDRAPLSSVLLMDRMGRAGLLATATDAELAIEAGRQSKSAMANTVAWTGVPDNWGGDAKNIQAVVDDARGYQAAIIRTRKVSSQSSPEIFGVDLFSAYELGDRQTGAQTGTEEAFRSGRDKTPVIVFPANLYTHTGEAAQKGSGQNADLVRESAFTAIRDAVGQKVFNVRLVDANLFEKSRTSILDALSDSDGAQALMLADDGSLRSVGGKEIIPSPLCALIKFAGLERPTEPISIQVVLPAFAMKQGVQNKLADLPQLILGDSAADYVSLRFISSPAAGDLSTAAAVAMETALTGMAGTVYLVDAPEEQPERSGKKSGDPSDYLSFNAAYAGAIARSLSLCIGALGGVYVLGRNERHVQSMLNLVSGALERQAATALNGKKSVKREDLDLRSIALSFGLNPAAFSAAVDDLEKDDITPSDIYEAVEATVADRLRDLGALIKILTPYDPGQLRSNPMRKNYGRRTRIDMASRYMRQVPWMWPDR